ELNLFADVTSTSNNYTLGVNSYLPTGTTLGVNLFGADQVSLSDFSALGVEAEETRNVFTTASASIRQSLLQGFRTTYNLAGVRSARRSLTSTEAAAYARRQQVLADTANSYWNLYYQQSLVQISQETLEITREERRVVIARIEQGDLAPVERARVEAAALESESSFLTAQNTAVSATETLLLLLGEDPVGQIALSSAPEPPSQAELDAEAALAEALSRNADLMQLREAEQVAKDNLANARHALLPELSGTASYALSGREPGGFSDAISEMVSGDLRTWTLGAELSVPLGNRSDRGAFEQRAAELTRATSSLEATERGLAQQVRAQVRAVTVARLQIQLAEANLRAAEETLSADRALRDAGRAIEKDVLESIRDVENARVSRAKSRADYNLALIELNRLRGAL
ncbi:MAG: outer membrane protein, partial [Myxococcota bacterium]